MLVSWRAQQCELYPRVSRILLRSLLAIKVGGSYDDTGLADITLAWMISQLSSLMSFDTEYVDWQHGLNTDYYRTRREPVRPWGMGKIYNSMTGIMVIAGKKIRTPGKYFASDTKSGKSTSRPLLDTQEYIHASVRVRKTLGGLGAEDRSPYNPTSLIGWHLEGDPKQNDVRWEYGNKGKGPERVLPEDTLGDLELEILSSSRPEYKAVTSKSWKLK